MTTTLPHDPAGNGPAEPGPARAGSAVDADRPSSADGPASALDEAAARLHAWHALREEAVERPSAAGPATLPAVPTADLGAAAGAAPAEDDELADRLRARRSARHVAAAYAAAHGHPLTVDDETRGPRRWSIGLRTAVVASVVVLLVAVGAAVVASTRPDDVITLAGGGAPSTTPSGAPSPSGGPSPASADGVPAATEEAEAPGTVVVHVVGEVREPGLVTVPTGARVADAVAAAGGTTRRADAAALNLARAVVDGEQIRVPRPGEEPPVAEGASDGTGGAEPGGGSVGGGADGLVDLNAAGVAELEELPGIGPALAERIVAWRDEQGPFTSVDELDEISGIGPSVLGQVRDLVRL